MSAPLLKPALVAALFAIGCSTAVPAQTTATATATAPTASKADANTPMARADRKFVEKLADDGMAEVELGKLAQQRASSDSVKQFGARMVEDHGRANDELKTIATSKGMTMPATMSKDHQKDLDKLGKLSGADFDHEYVKHMVAGHEKAVSALQREAKSGKDTELKSFASRTLPTVQDHLHAAQSLDESLKSSKS